jgi:hypothetical protein
VWLPPLLLLWLLLPLCLLTRLTPCTQRPTQVQAQHQFVSLTADLTLFRFKRPVQGRVFFFLGVVLSVLGCRSNPTYDTLTTLLPWQKQFAQVQPEVEYLWVSLGGRATVMALGERSLVGVAPNVSRHEYWYTGQGEMLYLRNGRIQEAKGFTQEWRGQTSSPPDWSDVLQSNRAISWRRQLDVLPGFRYNLIDHLTTYKLPAPKQLPEQVQHTAAWVGDSVESKNENGRAWRFEQRFAIENGVVVYSEQCLAPDLCLKLRPLGVVVPAK